MDYTESDFFPRITTAQSIELLRLVGQIDEFKGRWQASRLTELGADRLRELRDQSAIQSSDAVCRVPLASPAIVGAGRLRSAAPSDSPAASLDQALRGYRAVLAMIRDEVARDAPFDEAIVRALHAQLLACVPGTEPERGQYRTRDDYVAEGTLDGTRTVIARDGSPYLAPRRTRQLIHATRLAFDGGRLHPLLVVARFVIEFLAICPFQDGNARMAYALMTLLLLKYGYDHVSYAPLERIVEENEKECRERLRRSWRTMRGCPSAFSPWAFFFLRAVRAQQDCAQAIVDNERQLLRLSESQRRLLALIGQSATTTTTALAERLGVPPRTLRFQLNTLADQGLIEAHGDRRGRHYTVPTQVAPRSPLFPVPAASTVMAPPLDIFERRLGPGPGPESFPDEFPAKRSRKKRGPYRRSL